MCAAAVRTALAGAGAGGRRLPAAGAVGPGGPSVGSWDTNFALRGRDWSRFTRVGRMQDDDRDGVWECTVELGPGRYEYSFLVDSRFWEVDPNNPERAPDGRGGLVSLLVVP